MEWLNIYGLCFMAIIMLPNIVYAIKFKDAFENAATGRLLEITEQVGRYGCFALMIINIPGTCFGWLFEGAQTVYIAVNALLTASYVLIWILCFRRSSLFRALSLSVIPSVIFIFSGVMTRSVLLIAASAAFAAGHITISCRNALAIRRRTQPQGIKTPPEDEKK